MSNYRNLGDIVEQKQGFAFSSDDFNLDEGDTIVLTPGNFTADGNLYFGAKTKFFHGECSAEYRLNNGDLVLVMTDLTKEMNILGSAVEINSDKTVLLNQRIAKLKLLNAAELNKDFLRYYLNSGFARQHLKKRATGTTVRHISTNTLMSLPVLLPSIDEQQKIVEILSDCDAAISNLQSLIAHKLWLFERLPEQLSRSLSSIEDCELGEIADVTMGQSPPASSYNNVGEGLPLAGDGDDIKNGFVKPSRFTNHPTKIAPKGSVLMTVRAPVGNIAISDSDLCIGRGFCAIKPKSEASRDYIRYSLIAMKASWKSVQQGSTFTAVDKDSVIKFDMPFPMDEDELKRAVLVLQAAQSELQKLESQLDLLKQQKRGLMQQLLTGKRRVKVAA